MILIDGRHKVSHLKGRYKTNTRHKIVSVSSDAQTSRALSSSAACLLLDFLFSLFFLLLHVHRNILPTTKCHLCQTATNSVCRGQSESKKTAICRVDLSLRSVVASGNKRLVQVLVHIRSVCAGNYKPQTRSCWSAAAEKSSVLSCFRAKCKTRCE